MKGKNKLVAALLLTVSAFSLSSFSAAASGPANTEVYAIEQRAVAGQFNRYELAVSKVYNKNTSAYERLRVLRGGKSLSVGALMINGTPYVEVQSYFSALTDMKVTYYSREKKVNVLGAGFEKGDESLHR